MMRNQLGSQETKGKGYHGAGRSTLLKRMKMISRTLHKPEAELLEDVSSIDLTDRREKQSFLGMLLYPAWIRECQR